MSSAIGKTWEPRAASTPIGPLDPGFRPKLVSGVSFLVEGDTVQGFKLLAETAGLDASLMAVEPALPLEERHREGLTRARAHLDGAHTLLQVAAAAGWEAAECAGLLQGLYERAIVYDAAALPAPALSFYRHAVALGRRETLGALGRSPWVEHMLRGTLTRPLIVGYLVEEYHLVASAASHIAPAIAAAPTERLRMMFSDYLSGEYWHCQLLKRGLLAAGLSEEELAAADPLPGTLAVINLVREMARTDLLSYSACLSISEGGDVQAAEAFSRIYDLIAGLGLVTPEVLAPSREHVVLDCEDQHETLGAEPFADEVVVSGPRQDAIYRAVLATTGTHLEQHRQITAYYGAPGARLVHSYR